MAITEDASTPPIASGTGGATPLTTASFSPPAGSVMVALVAAGYQDVASGVPGITVTDSVGGTWLPGPTVASSTGNFLGRTSIFLRALPSAPGSMTVSANYTNINGGRFIKVVVLNGAALSQAGAATITRDVNTNQTDWTQSIVSTKVDSVFYGVVDDPNVNNTVSAAANTSLVGTAFNDSTDGIVSAAFKSTAATVTPGSISLGVTMGTTSQGILAIQEIVPFVAANDAPPFTVPGMPGMPPGSFGMFWQPFSPGDPDPLPATGVIAGTTQPVTADFNGTSDLLRKNDAEGGTPAATVATSDTGSGDQWDAVTIGTGASVVYSSTPDLAGNVGITYDVGVTSSSAFTQWTVGNTATPFAGFRFSYAAQFGGTCSIFSLNQGGTAYIRAQITAANKLRILDAAGATLYTSTVTLSPGTKYFLALGFVAAVAGTYQLKLYDVNGALLETVSPTAGDFTAATNIVRFGSVANQTNTNWKATTMDEFYFSSTTMPVPSDQAALAGTTQPVTAAFVGTGKASGAIAGTTAAVTADFNGTATTSGITGVITGTTQPVTADFNGTSTGKGPIAGTTQVVTADFNGTSKSTGTIAGSTQPVTADLNGTGKTNGVIAGATQVTTADFNGTSTGRGPIAGTTQPVAADFNGTSKDNGVLAGVTQAVTADLNGTAKASGPIAGTTQKATAHFTGSASGGYIVGVTQPVTADFNGVAKATATVAGVTQVTTADFNGLSTGRAVLAGVTQLVTADINGAAKSAGAIAGTTQLVTAHFTAVGPDVEDQSDLFPFWVSRHGYASYPQE